MPGKLDITSKGYERIFVTGKILGDSLRLMRFLYDQNFNYRDALVISGDLINIENVGDSISLMEFLKANDNCYAVSGDQEIKYVKYTSDEDLKNKVNYQLLDKAESTYKEYIAHLPSIIKVMPDYYVVHAGVNPVEGINTLDEETYYLIDKYDSNSRFYQFVNPEKRNWYDFKIFDGETQIKIIFSALETPSIEVPAGYSLYRAEQQHSALMCMILTSDSSPTILEVK